MRFKVIFINTNNDNYPMPVDNTHILKSYINKCLGVNNEYHGSIGKYSVSNIIGGKLNKETLTLSFENGCFFVVSSDDMIFINKLMMAILKNKEYGYGLTFDSFEPISETFYDGWNNFATLTPFIIDKKGDNGLRHYITLKEDNFEKYVETYLKNKLLKIDNTLILKDFKVKIDRHHKSHKTKKVFVKTNNKDVMNIANQCFISIFCSKKIAEIIYTNGVGKSTNIGFGTIYKTENKQKYTVYDL